MDLVEVDPVGLETPQAVVDLPDDPAARVAVLVRVVAHAAVDLGGEHDVLAAAIGKCLADDLLRLPARVDIRGVDEVDPRVERAVDDADRVLVIGVAPGAEHHRAETERAHLHTGPAEWTHLHGCHPTPRDVAASAQADARARPRDRDDAGRAPLGSAHGRLAGWAAGGGRPDPPGHHARARAGVRLARSGRRAARAPVAHRLRARVRVVR